MVLDFKVNKKIGCRDDNQFFYISNLRIKSSTLWNLLTISDYPTGSFLYLDRNLYDKAVYGMTFNAN